MKKPSDFLLIERINQCPKLASLKSINDTLKDLLDSEDSFVSQIAEVIRPRSISNYPRPRPCEFHLFWKQG